jgi:UDPglucose 6-dehydrogenase/GDP-mannose 6-dehydrogenase
LHISVIGTGYVGLVSGACLAEAGHRVVCVDLDPDKVAGINRGDAPIHERGLEVLLRKHVGQGLRATTDLAAAVGDSELTLICVGTPSRAGDIDLGQIVAAARSVGAALARKTDYHVVAVKSTVVPGTTDHVVRPALEESSGRRAGPDFGVGMNPEFLTEGQAVDDFMNPDRLVLGGMDEATHRSLARLYEGFEGVPVLRVGNATAEMIKYASNALLATQISFANEIANLCATFEHMDVTDVMEGVHLSHYLQPFLAGGTERIRAPIASFLEAGCGFGGSCLPKDVTALAAQGRKRGSPMPLLEAVLETNARQPGRMIELLERHIPDLTDVPVTVLGLAFKPDTDDMRQSPALPIIAGLLARGARVRAYDPVARATAREALAGHDVALVDTLDEAVEGARAVLLVTRWDEFQRVPDLVARLDPQPLVVDGRRVLDPDRFVRYEGIGRGPEGASRRTSE